VKSAATAHMERTEPEKDKNIFFKCDILFAEIVFYK